MVEIAVAAIIEHNGRVLVGKKIKMDGHFLSEKWHMPGGRLDKDESEKEALAREMLEEAGIDVKVIKLLDEFYNKSSDTLVKWYLCSPVTFNTKPGDDLEEVKFVPKSDVMNICDMEAVSRWPQKIKEYFTID